MSVRIATSTAQAAGLTLRRAIPRKPGHLLVELIDDQGMSIAGQWFDDPAEAARVARDTAPRAESSVWKATPVRLLAGHLLLQPGGADRRLPALRRLLTEPDCTLVAHRPERRGVVRRRSGFGGSGTHTPASGTGTREDGHLQTYSKVVRPDKVAGVLAGLAGGRAGGLRTPRVIDVDPNAGVVTTAALPGRTLHDLLTAGPDRTPRHWRRIGVAVGDSLAALHRAPGGTSLAVHDADTELAVSRRWVDLAVTHGLLDRADPAAARAWSAAHAGLAGESNRTPVVVAPVHRDLHDKQLLVDDGGDIGVLDLDLLAAGDPALDLANLLVHLELRVRQGVADRDAAAACAAGLLAGHRAHPAGGDAHRRLPGYAWATRLRLLAVYAFRPDSAGAARLLVTDPAPLIEDYR